MLKLAFCSSCKSWEGEREASNISDAGVPICSCLASALSQNYAIEEGYSILIKKSRDNGAFLRRRVSC